MAYADATSLGVAVGGSTKLVQLTDDNGDGTSDTAVIDAIVAEAQGVIDSYVRHVHRVPLSSPPPSITTLCNKMAARVARRRRGMPLQTDPTDDETDRKWLDAVSKGLITLGIEPEPDKSDLQVDDVGDRDSLRTVTRERTKGYW